MDDSPPPLGSPEEFHQMLADLVDEFAPRRFAICEEYGDRADGGIFAWGLAFTDGVLACGDGHASPGASRARTPPYAYSLAPVAGCDCSGSMRRRVVNRGPRLCTRR
ncbi:hypothetical protein Vqi01_05830 [Micromonospora qiuiae]|uniref:Uncharacterized protein n=1 Tax=Micromonospora qiuiae TaxID=502268 RepID=A0ABQ4J5I5_9ACTN|nr:hypothetical protein Vqi01_05830 [Micromonospora qiuiae]